MNPSLLVEGKWAVFLTKVSARQMSKEAKARGVELQACVISPYFQRLRHNIRELFAFLLGSLSPLLDTVRLVVSDLIRCSKGNAKRVSPVVRGAKARPGRSVAIWFWLVARMCERWCSLAS